MSDLPTLPLTGFLPRERDYIRRELAEFYSIYPRVADGFRLRMWRGSLNGGQPRVPAPAATMMERGLLRLDATLRPPRLFFTDVGLDKLRAMMADRRFAEPFKFAHVRQELGLDPDPVAVV